MESFWGGFEKRAMAAAVGKAVSKAVRGYTRSGAPIEGLEAVRKKVPVARRPAPAVSQQFPGTTPIPAPAAPKPKKPDLITNREARKIQRGAKVKSPGDGTISNMVAKHPALTAGAVGIAGGYALGRQSDSGYASGNVGY